MSSFHDSLFNGTRLRTTFRELVSSIRVFLVSLHQQACRGDGGGHRRRSLRGSVRVSVAVDTATRLRRDLEPHSYPRRRSAAAGEAFCLALFTRTDVG